MLTVGESCNTVVAVHTVICYITIHVLDFRGCILHRILHCNIGLEICWSVHMVSLPMLTVGTGINFLGAKTYSDCDSIFPHQL